LRKKVERSTLLTDGRINIVKMALLTKAIYMFNTIPIKIPMTFIIEIKKSTLKFMSKHKRCQISKAIINKRAMLEVSQYLTSNLQSHSNKSRWYWHKNRYE
jgi:hypothetical protein